MLAAGRVCGVVGHEGTLKNKNLLVQTKVAANPGWSVKRGTVMRGFTVVGLPLCYPGPKISKLTKIKL